MSTKTNWKFNYAGGFAYRYIIIEDKKIIKCQLRLLDDDHTLIKPVAKGDCFYDSVASNLIDKATNGINDTHRTYFSAFVSHKFNNIVAQAKLNPNSNDVWDIEKGKKIAYDRAVLKLSIKRNQQISKCVGWLHKCVDNLENIIVKNVERINTLNSELKNLTD